MRLRYIHIFICILTCRASLYAAEFNNIDIHGFISQGYIKSCDNNYFANTKEGTFQFNETGINFTSVLSPNLHIGIQLFTRDMGEIGNDEITVDWAFADYRFKEWIGIRVGKIKNPIGLYNEVRDMDMLRTFINLPQSIYQDKYRESWVAFKGIGVYGMIDTDMLGMIGYQFQAGSMAADKESGAARYFESMMGYFEFTDDFDVNTTYSGKIDWQTPTLPLHLAVSTLIYDFVFPVRLKETFNPTPADPVTIVNNFDDYCAVIGSIEYTVGNMVMAFEYCEIYTQGAMNFSADSQVQFKNTSQGYYGSVAYRFYDRFELGTYYGVYYVDKSDTNGEDFVAKLPYKKKFQAWSKDTCLSARFDIHRNWICKIESHFINGAADLFDMDNYDDDTPVLNFQPVLDLKKNWMLLAAKLSYIF